MRSLLRTALVLVVVSSVGCLAHASNAAQPPYGYPEPRYDDPYLSPEWEVGFFYRELSPFGDWIHTYEYGWSWLPRDVHAGWRPYYYGHWVLCEYGWYWVSYEPFGWATYHYGRWSWHPRLGWIWVPGRVWGPAWVAWQYGGGYVGWAPLPPEVGFDFRLGLRFDGFDLRAGLHPHAYVFVEERRFLEREAYRHAAPPARNVTIIHNTTNITNITVVENRVINRGIEPERVERATGRRAKRLRVAETQSEKSERVRGEEVVVYRPPKARLDTVRVDESKPGRGRAEIERERPGRREPPGQDERARPERSREIEVAPRVAPESPANERRLDREEQRERQELQAYEREQRQRLERLQRDERERQQELPAAREREIEERHAREKRALDEELRRARQQLEARQEVEREAAKAGPPGRAKAEEKEADSAKSGKKGKAKGQEKSKKKPPAEEPPPHRRR
jgi:hypothetical protein